MSLYFIALVPHKALREEIQKIKKSFSERFGAKHALKLPAHITLQIPFKMESEREPQLLKILQEVVKDQDELEIRLSGFGSFPPRVIFIKLVEHAPVIEIFQEIQEKLRESAFLQEREKMESIHPHITVATRDLDKKNFKNAWAEYKVRKFEAGFTANSLFIFKHNGKTWDILEEICFRKEQASS